MTPAGGARPGSGRPFGYTTQREMINDQRRRDRAREELGPDEPGPYVQELSSVFQGLQAQACARVAAGDPAAVEDWFTGHCGQLAEERRRVWRR